MHEIFFIRQQLQAGRDAEFEDVSNRVMYKKICAESTKNNNNTYGYVEEEM